MEVDLIDVSSCVGIQLGPGDYSYGCLYIRDLILSHMYIYICIYKYSNFSPRPLIYGFFSHRPKGYNTVHEFSSFMRKGQTKNGRDLKQMSNYSTPFKQ